MVCVYTHIYICICVGLFLLFKYVCVCIYIHIYIYYNYMCIYTACYTHLHIDIMYLHGHTHIIRHSRDAYIGVVCVRAVSTSPDLPLYSFSLALGSRARSSASCMGIREAERPLHIALRTPTEQHLNCACTVCERLQRGQPLTGRI